MDEAAALALWTKYAQAFPAAYTEQTAPGDALSDIGELEALGSAADAMRLAPAPRGQ